MSYGFKIYFIHFQDLYCGFVDSEQIGLVTAVERIIRHVFMEALAHPSPDCEDDSVNCPMIKNQLLPGLRSFCSALKGTVTNLYN